MTPCSLASYINVLTVHDTVKNKPNIFSHLSWDNSFIPNFNIWYIDSLMCRLWAISKTSVLSSFIGQSHWGSDRWATTCNLKILGSLWWSLKGRRPSYDGHWRFWWSLGVSTTTLRAFGHIWCMPSGHREVVCSRRLVGDCRMMVFRGRRKVVVFSSRRPLVSATGRRPRSPTSQQPVANRLEYHKIWLISATGRQLVADYQQPVTDHSPTSSNWAVTGGD